MMNTLTVIIRKTFIVFSLFFSVSSSILAQTSSVKYSINSGVPNVLVSVGDYEVRFAKNHSWTYREITYNDKKIITPTGAHQPVLKEQKVPAGTDSFLGTGHRQEKIELVEIQVIDNAGNVQETHSVDDNLDLTGNNTYIFRKKSKFESEVGGLYYLHESKITISENGVKEDYFFEAAADDYTNIHFMYAFMHCFGKTVNNWVVGDNSGITQQGEFLSDNSFTLRKDIRFCLLHDPKQHVGISIIYPVIYKGTGIRNAFWNRPRDNKHYLMVEPAKTKGEKFSYYAEIKVFNANNQEDFLEKGKAIINKEI